MLALKILLYILSGLMGLAVGSFLNVCIYRLPRGTFFSKARSFCPKCGTPIKAYDNIPILSYIILRGKCRACHEKISPRYPIIEALNTIFWLVNFAVFGINYWTIVADILVSTLIVVAMVDFDTTEIPDSAIITIILLGLVTFIPVFGMDWKSKLIGAFCVSLPMLIIAFFGGMGYGDVKLYFALGLLFGWENTLVLFLFSLVIGSVAGIINMVIVRRKNAGNDEENSVETDAKMLSQTYKNTSENSENLTPTMSKNESADELIDNKIYQENAVEIGEKEQERTQVLEDENEEKTLTADEQFDKDLEEKLAKGKAFAFGPYIVIGSVIALYFGKAIVELYKGIIGL